MNENPYGNILKAALGNTPQNPGLTMQQRVDNQNVCNQMSEQGIYIPELLKRMDRMESEMKELRDAPKQTVDRDLFRVMEASVKDDPKVREKKQLLSDTKTLIITELCMKDNRYKTAWDDYKTTVNAVYIERKEHGDRISAQIQAEDREGIGGEVRYNKRRSDKAEKGLPSSEEDEPGE